MMSNERLEELLGDIDFSPLDGVLPWQVEEDPLNSPDGIENTYTIRSGWAKLNLEITRDKTKLSWGARLPDYFLPDDANSYMEFLAWILQRLPDRMFPNPEEPLTAYQTREAYRRESRVDVVFDNDDKQSYSLGSEMGDKALLVDFVKRGERVKSVTINASDAPLLRRFDYVLAYTIGDEGEAAMELVVPVNSHHLDAWNPKTLEWVLGLHKDKDKLGDLGEASKGLSQIVRAKAEEGLSLRPEPEE